MHKIRTRDGFTLVEVMIAMVVMTIGILAVAQMQVRAINQNSNAFDRTRANNVALAVLEELKRLPFNDAALAAGGGDLDAGRAPQGAAPTPGNADHLFIPANFPGLTNSFTVNGNTIVDGNGRRYQLFYNVLRPTITIGTDTFTPTCTIRLFVYWNTPMGQSFVELTTVKYNNVQNVDV
jgi:type IV pilus assembly protein PilV